LNNSGFAQKYGPVALVLGGSEGIGRQFAESLAAAGLDLVLVARTPGPLAAAAGQLRAAHGVSVITYAHDLTNGELGPFAAQLLAAHDLGLVVCNAGATHGVGTFLDQPLGKALDLVSLNCLVPLTFAHQVLGRRRGRGGAGLILVSSMSGLCGSGLIATYAAAKAFEIALCEGLHFELRGEGLDVLCAVAGLTDTPAMRRSGLSFEAAAGKGYQAMDAAEVARGALEQLGRTAVWYAVGDRTAEALRRMSREQLILVMSQAAAAMYGVALPGDAKR
jgi:uncharacterized protein